MKLLLLFFISFAGFFEIFAQVDPPPAIEGGRGFIQTQTANLYGTGYFGAGLTGIYTSTKIQVESGREELLIGAVNLTYDFSEELEFTGNLFVIGRARLYDDSGQYDQFKQGFGKGMLAAKYRFPFTGKNFDLGSRLVFHVPMGANFMVHPSYPFDTDSYGLELALLESIDFNQSLRLHLNQGIRWQGLKEESRYSEDLLLLSLALDYNLTKNWLAFSELSSAIELDDKVEPIKDRLVFSQGVRYITPWSMGFNLAVNLGLSEDRTDGTIKRAEDWRVFFGVSFSKRTYLADDDEDGIPNIRDEQPRTPKGWPVDGKGMALDSDADGIPDGVDQEPNTFAGAVVDRYGKAIDSDMDGVPDGIDKEAQTAKGAKVDKEGRAIDSDGDGVPDGIDLEPNSPTGALVSVKGISIDGDGDGVPDGIDQEPASPKGAKVDVRGITISQLEAEFLTKGILRVNKIYFDTGKATIKVESHNVLMEIGKMLEKYPDLKVQINGHTDAIGNDDFNFDLSVQRAESVRAFLVSRFSDINSYNLTVRGFGRSKPLSDNRTEDGRTLNRRVEFEVLNPELLEQYQ